MTTHYILTITVDGCTQPIVRESQFTPTQLLLNAPDHALYLVIWGLVKEPFTETEKSVEVEHRQYGKIKVSVSKLDLDDRKTEQTQNNVILSMISSNELDKKDFPLLEDILVRMGRTGLSWLMQYQLSVGNLVKYVKAIDALHEFFNVAEVEPKNELVTTKLTFVKWGPYGPKVQLTENSRIKFSKLLDAIPTNDLAVAGLYHLCSSLPFETPNGYELILDELCHLYPQDNRHQPRFYDLMVSITTPLLYLDFKNTHFMNETTDIINSVSPSDYPLLESMKMAKRIEALF